jgi:cellulose synthase operon protein C
MKTPLITLLLFLHALPLSAQDKAEDTQLLLKEAHTLKTEATKALEMAGSKKDAEKQEHLKIARNRLLKSRELFAESLQLLQAESKAYPKFIDRKKNPEQYAARARVVTSMIKTELEIAGNSYQQARAADSDDKSRDTLLLQASKEYEKTHQKYRTLLGGLVARYWQARCFHEMGDLRKALGIFNELLGHRGGSPQILLLQDRARHQRLACLNHPSRKDYQLVIQESRRWIDESTESRRKSTSGQGIQWEFARGLEMFAMKSTSDEEREKLLGEAVSVLSELSKAKGFYQKPAEKKLEKLQAK